MKLPDTLALIQALVRLPSVSSTDPQLDRSNLPVVELLAEWLEALGWTVEIQPLAQHKANLIATIGPRVPGQGLVLSGHTDTVPCDERRWTSDPFQVTERDGRLYGLGCADMKSFFAIALAAFRELEAKQLRHSLTLLATADEESTMSGARHLCQRKTSLGRYAVIGEPTALRPICMHKGVMMEAIQITGHSGHSSDPSLGTSALEGMHSALGALLAWRDELQHSHRNPAFKVPVTTLNLGVIRGGDNPNRICGYCETQIDIRPLPGMDIDQIRHSLQQRLEAVVAHHPGLSLKIHPLFEGIAPFQIAADSELVKTTERLSECRCGAVAFGTEAPYLSQLGMETVVLGPGSIEQAHQPDEFLAMDQIKPAIRILRGLIRHYCIEPAKAKPAERGR